MYENAKDEVVIASLSIARIAEPGLRGNGDVMYDGDGRRNGERDDQPINPSIILQPRI